MSVWLFSVEKQFSRNLMFVKFKLDEGLGVSRGSEVERKMKKKLIKNIYIFSTTFCKSCRQVQYKRMLKGRLNILDDRLISLISPLVVVEFTAQCLIFKWFLFIIMENICRLYLVIF